MTWLQICSILLLLAVCHSGDSIKVDMEDTDWEWGSGLHEQLHIFSAENPFMGEMPENHVVNCTQHFLLPPSLPVCWEDIAGPKEFEETRLLVLQNQAALQAVTEVSGLEEVEASYSEQAMSDVQGVREDQLSISLTVQSIEKVFFDLEENRKHARQQQKLSSLKENIANTNESINGRKQISVRLEQHLSHIERTLNGIQQRLNRLLAH
ncbi:uncharacterized protein si:ch211-57n23.1 [Trichomycterus rosablanca]|uniref:uncharacterized protein si:ch211-57n23.1 n=1 Tax=Trichomycterus rosablanca TaxID=2290929 RepID=UPI002F35A226